MPPPLVAAAALAVSYRPMSEEDLPFVAELYASTRREEVAMTGWPRDTQEAFLQQQHQAQHHHYSRYYPDAERLIIERDGEAIGRLYLRGQPDYLHVLDISLVAGSRGHGIGGAILRDILDEARERGQAVSIFVEKTNPARRLYSRLGFWVAEDHGVYDLMRAQP